MRPPLVLRTVYMQPSRNTRRLRDELKKSRAVKLVLRVDAMLNIIISPYHS